MKNIRLDGSKMTNQEQTHDYLKRKLALPDYYGANLDALWDVLSSDFLPRQITIIRPEKITENLGLYGESLLKLFVDVAKANKMVTVTIKRGSK